MPNPIAGYNGVMYTSSDGGTTWVANAELQDVKIKVDNKMLDATVHSSGGVTQYQYGNTTWSATAGVISAFGDAAYTAIVNAAVSKTTLKFRFDPAGEGSGLPRREGFGLIQTLEESQPNLDLETTAITIQGTGALAISTQ